MNLEKPLGFNKKCVHPNKRAGDIIEIFMKYFYGPGQAE